MFAIERRKAVTRLIREQGSVTLSGLSAMFGVSSETVRKDLLALEKEGVLERTHGGAVKTTRPATLAPLQERRKDHLKEKQELGGYALRLIRNGDTIVLDEGSTSAELAKLIACTFTSLTVATYSLEVFHILSENPGIRLILCGGAYQREEAAFSGQLTLEMLDRMHFDKCFLCPSSISLRFGLLEYLEEFAMLQQKLMARSDKTYVLAYSDRFETSAGHICLAEVTDKLTFVTDSGLPEDIYRRYLEKGVTIIKE